MQFRRQWKLLIHGSFIEVSSSGYDLGEVIIGLDDGLTPNRRQAII